MTTIKKHPTLKKPTFRRLPVTGRYRWRQNRTVEVKTDKKIVGWIREDRGAGVWVVELRLRGGGRKIFPHRHRTEYDAKDWIRDRWEGICNAYPLEPEGDESAN